jgi:hypothetical protein
MLIIHVFPRAIICFTLNATCDTIKANLKLYIYFNIQRFISSYSIRVSHLLSREFHSNPRRGVLDTTCDKVCQVLASGQWSSLAELTS